MVYDENNLSFEQHWKMFKNDLCPWAPYFSHVFEAWKNRANENLFFAHYEEMCLNRRCVIERLSNFLGKKLTKDELDKLVNHVEFENFRKNNAVNYKFLEKPEEESKFIRKGEVNGWKNYFTDELNEDANEWIEANLKNSDFKFYCQ